MRFTLLRAAAALGITLIIGACASLPSSSPTVNQVLDGAKPQDVAVIDVVPGTPSGQSAARVVLQPWEIGDGFGENEAIRSGDRLTISVFEVGYSLFASAPSSDAQGSTSSGSARTFPPIVVPESGIIHFPYAGTIMATGMSAETLARTIESRLRGKSQFAQVLAVAEPGPSRSVLLSGDVVRPGRVTLSSAHERLLDVIALAGGPQARKADTIVRLIRNNATSAARLDEIDAGAAQNVVLSAGDRIELVRSTRTLTVLGAARTVTEVPFDSARLTLSEALARAGGPLDDKADATGVFIFRQEVAERDGQPERRAVIYRLNLLVPASYFAAQQFEMREKDIMLIANSRSTQIAKFIQMVNALSGPAITADFLTR